MLPVKRSLTSSEIHRNTEERDTGSHRNNRVANLLEGTNAVNRKRTDLSAEAPENHGHDKDNQNNGFTFREFAQRNQFFLDPFLSAFDFLDLFAEKHLS